MKYLGTILFLMVFLLNSCAIDQNSVRDNANKAKDTASAAADSKEKVDGKEKAGGKEKKIGEKVKKSIGSLFSKDKGKASNKGKAAKNKVSKDDVTKYVKGHPSSLLWLLLIVIIIAGIVSWLKFLKKNGRGKK